MDIGLLLAAVAEDAVKPGSVDAPIGVIIGAAVVVTAALTFAIPAALKPGAAILIYLCKRPSCLNLPLWAPARQLVANNFVCFDHCRR